MAAIRNYFYMFCESVGETKNVSDKEVLAVFDLFIQPFATQNSLKLSSNLVERVGKARECNLQTT
jgi:hypothetical protein